MKINRLSAIILSLLLLPTHGLALDATSFDPLQVSVAAQGAGIPVGTVIAWPLASNPSDGSWLECNGQAVSASYPELRAMMASVPDYRGLFLRGYGSQGYSQNNGATIGVTSTVHTSGSLGVIQGDATRAIQGQAPLGDSNAEHSTRFTGAFYLTGSNNIGSGDTDHDNPMAMFDSGRVTPTANENRPVNKAVRYLIRARS